MTVNRRNFLKATLSGAAMAVGSTAIASCTGKPAETSEPAACPKACGIEFNKAAQLERETGLHGKEWRSRLGTGRW